MVQEFTQAAGETTESFTTDDGSGSGPQTQTRQSVSAGESEGGQPQHSYGDMVRPGGALGDGRGSLLESIYLSTSSICALLRHPACPHLADACAVASCHSASCAATRSERGSGGVPAADRPSQSWLSCRLQA